MSGTLHDLAAERRQAKALNDMRQRVGRYTDAQLDAELAKAARSVRKRAKQAARRPAWDGRARKLAHLADAEIVATICQETRAFRDALDAELEEEAA